MGATRSQAPPFTIALMQPTLVAQPLQAEDWVWEEKIDGYRMVAYKTGSTVNLISRHGIDHTVRFPDLATAGASVPYENLVLDGEVAVFDEQLSPASGGSGT